MNLQDSARITICSTVRQWCSIVIERFWQCHREKAREGFTLLGINYDDGYLDFRVIQSPLWSNQIRIIYGRTKSDGKKSFAMMKGNYISGSTKLSSEWLTAGDKFLYFSMVMHRRVSLEFDVRISKSDMSWQMFARFCAILQESAICCKTLQDYARYCKILQDSARFCKILQDSARFWKILQDSARFCKFLQDFAMICNILHNLARFCRILYNFVLVWFCKLFNNPAKFFQILEDFAISKL